MTIPYCILLSTSELTPEAAEEKLQEVTNETEKAANPIDNALKDTNLTDNQKDQIAETLKDETATVTEKAEAATDAASSAYIPFDLFQTEGGRRLQFMLAGEPSIRRMAEREEQTRILENLRKAEYYDNLYKGYSEEGSGNEEKSCSCRTYTGYSFEC